MTDRELLKEVRDLIVMCSLLDKSGQCEAMADKIDRQLSIDIVSKSLPLQTKLEMFYDFLFERGIANQLGVGIDTIVKHFIDEKLLSNDS